MTVTAAIPVFNGVSYLERTVPGALRQGFRRVYVLDDDSTDGTAGWCAAHPDVQLVAGNRRLGPPGNRNRVLEVETDDIVVFLDADVELLTDGAAAILDATFARHPEMAVMGALIVDDNDEPIPFYCGYDQSPFLRGVAEALRRVTDEHGDDPAVMRTVREFAHGLIAHLEPVAPRTIDWVSEQFFAVRAGQFRELGGFDTGYPHFHEGPDYCKRVRDLGCSVRVNPDIRGRHRDMHTGTDDERMAKLLASTAHWYRKHYDVPQPLIDKFFLD